MNALVETVLVVLLSLLGLVLAVFLLVSLLRIITRPAVLAEIWSDLSAIRERDPAAEGWIACLFYPGLWALTIHRLAAHSLYGWGLRTPARLFNFLARLLTGTDIHPGAQFGRGVFIDHAHGVVIGETAVVKDNVTMLHQVTLGGTGKETGKRHPTIEEGVLLGVGSKVLGNIIVGRNSKIGAGSVVVHAVPPDSTVVGIPGKVVASGGQRVPARHLDQVSLPDPMQEKLMEVQSEVKRFRETIRLQRSASGSLDLLQKILADQHEVVNDAKTAVPLDRLRERRTRREQPRKFYNAIKAPGLSLISEIKKASPSGGLIRENFDPAELARIYEQANASALSVLTNEKFFQGSLDDIAKARNAAKLPILRKEFIVDEYQIVEAERYGADAVLLIVCCLDLTQLRDFREATEGEGMDALVEVHDEAELEVAQKSGARLIGINNRDLKTLKVDLQTTFRLAKLYPRHSRGDVLLISESGITKPEDIRWLVEAGLDGVLIGETFMRAPDVGGKVRELMNLGEFHI